MADLVHRHGHQALGLAGGRVVVGLVHPGDVLPQGRQVEQVGVEGGLGDGVLEQGLVGARRARGDDHAVEAQF